MAEKAVWDDARLKKLIEIFKEEVENGNRPLGYFTKKGWNNVIEKWEARMGKKHPKDKFKNKWDAIKNDYVFFMELKNEATGLGWDDAKRTVVCSQEWWDEHVGRCQEKTGKKCNHLKFKRQGPKHLDDLHVIFDKVHVTGASASSVADISSDESSDDNVHVTGASALLEKPDDSDEMKLTSLKKQKTSKKRKQPSMKNEEKEEKSPFLRLYKQTCEKIESGVEKITSSVEASSTPPATNLVPTISEVMKLVKDNIKPRDPTYSYEHEKIREERFWPHFKGAIGAIDGSHVPVTVPVDDAVNHRCRHGFTSQNVLAICDFDMRFTFLVAGWPGSAHDSRILNHALAHFSSFPVPPKGKYYLVDSGYANRIGYLAPFKGSTYHLPEFRLRRHRPPQGKYELFNFSHSSLRNVVERAFGVLKQKWRILKGIPSFSPRTQKHIIIACMALHNFIRDSKLSDKFFDKCDADDEYVPPVLRQEVTPTQVDAVEEENEDTMDIIRSTIADACLAIAT